METYTQKRSLPFLEGGGEMGSLTRNYNWSLNSIGAPENWPQSLKTTLGILLHSAFPMFLFWGDELTCFYNDAYRPSLGAGGKHPAVGKKGKEVWPEIWDFIGPLIEKVMDTGNSVWFEDQLLPIYRNGQLEDVYWTFSYSPAYNDDAKIAGVFVTCTETTQQVLTRKKMEQDEVRIRSVIASAPAAMSLFVGRDLVVEMPNQAFIEIVGKGPGIEGKPLREVMPELLTENQPFLKILDDVYTSGKMFQSFGSQVQIVRNGVMTYNYYNITYTPLFDTDGNVFAILDIAIDVTEAINARQALEESELNLRNIIRQSPVATGILKGPDYVVEIANQRMYELWGRGEKDLLQKPIFEGLPEAKGQGLEALLHDVYTTGKTFRAFERPVTLPRDGKVETVYLNFVYEPFYADGKTVTGIMAIAIDVTEQVVARKKIEESEASFRLLADSMPQFVWAGDTNGNLTYFNEAVYSYSGLTQHEINNGGWIEIVHPEEREENVKRWMHAIATGEEFVFQHRFKNKHGEYRWQLSRATPQRDDKNRIQMWIGTSTDIHQQKLLQEELQESVEERTREVEVSRQQIERSAQRLAAVFDHAQMGMFTFAPVTNSSGDIVDFRFVITNPTFAGYVGQTPQVLNGELGSTWFPGYLTNGVFDMYKHTYITGDTQRRDIHYHVDQHDLYLDLRSSKVGDEVLVTFTDFTPLKRAQMQLEKYVEELKNSNASLEEFAYAASHDMKEPIRKIHFFSDKLKNGMADRMTDDERATFVRIENASTRMAALIDDLLLYSHITQKPHEKEEVNLNEKISRVMEDLELDIHQKKATINVDSLPTIKGYRRQLQQLFQNLMSNALKYSKQDAEPFIHISCEAVTEKEAGLAGKYNEAVLYYKITVKDNGIGFEQSEAERIFQMFQRLHGRAEYQGTGVGLAIAKKVAENHGGRITAESTPGDGASFIIYLPKE